MAAKVGDIVLPGDEILSDTDDVSRSRNCSIILGPGLREECGLILATKPGIVRFRDPAIYWIDLSQKRYVPAKGDFVIGIITNTGGDIFRANIGTSEPAALSYLAFEGATKRNRPNVKIGDIIYARLLVAGKGMEPELVCIEGNGKSGGLGVLSEGFLIYTSSTLCQRLLSPEDNVLKGLGKFPYEIAVGLNGRVWCKGRSIKETLALSTFISGLDNLNDADIKAAVKRFIKALP